MPASQSVLQKAIMLKDQNTSTKIDQVLLGTSLRCTASKTYSGGRFLKRGIARHIQSSELQEKKGDPHGVHDCAD